MTLSQLHHDVTIVGAGPVGLMLGCWLRKLGLGVIVVEKRATRSTQSKASSMNAYSLAILHALGIHERFARAGKPVQNLMLYWNARRLMRVNYQHVPSRYKHILCLSQPETEALLEASFREWGGTLVRSTEVLGFRQDGEGVDVDVRAAGATAAVTVRSAYLVGCDGGRSLVRQGLGVAFPGIDHGTGFIMFDARIRWDGDLDTVHYFVRDDGFLIVIPQAAGTHRIIIRTPDNERTDVGADRLAGYRRLTAQYGPAGLVVEDVLWESETRYYNRLADRYGEGRVFLAGDACHLFSSIGGLGMNTGFQDALALAWRLAGVVQGRLRVDVLDSYGQERRAITQQLIASTDANTRLITRDDTDPAGALRGWLPVMANRRRMAHVLPLNFSGLGQAYGAGLIVGGGVAPVGKLIPCFELDDGALRGCSYDLVDGRHFVFIHAGEPGPALRAALEQARPVRLLRLADGPGHRAARDCLQLRAGHGVLIRPDGIVALHAPLQSVDVYAAYLRSVAARSTPDFHRNPTVSQHETITHF